MRKTVNFIFDVVAALATIIFLVSIGELLFYKQGRQHALQQINL